jgi:SAM-dependent methyltransferase
MSPNPTQRFSSRVENYVKYRPGYPRGVTDLLVAQCGLTPASIIADLGSGTGLLTRLFLENGNGVIAIEPNPEMRQAAERLLGGDPSFVSLDATAEATGLPNASVDFVTAGQAFHWFQLAPTRAECRRILKRGGWVVLIWNARRRDATPFMRDYEAVLKTWSTEYATINHRDRVGEDELNAFFGPGWRRATVDNKQRLDYDGLRGRLLSSSYAPEAGQPSHEPMLRDLAAVFDRHAQSGQVTFLYETEVFYGRPG